jgi:hypothetical protein
MKLFEDRKRLVLPYVLIIGVALLRLESGHPFHFVPIFSCLLFFAAMRPLGEFVLPLAVLIGVDIFLTTHQYGYPLTSDDLVTWSWYLIALLLGAGILRNTRSLWRVVGSTLLASVSFFLASNFSVWCTWTIYPKTLSGLGICYVAALPFFRNGLTSELIFSLLLFGLGSYARGTVTADNRPGHERVTPATCF